MPRRYRRNSVDGGVGLLVVLVLAVLLLLWLMNNGQVSLPFLTIPNFPSVTIPITGLPKINLPTLQVHVTLEPDKLVIPGISLDETPVPGPSHPLALPARKSGCRLQGSLPDPACTPGAVTSVTADQVCQAGFQGEAFSGAGAQVFQAYGIDAAATSQYQIDQLVPASLGGANDLANLWPQPLTPTPALTEKNRLEATLHDQVCVGKLSLADAQQRIALNWLAAYQQIQK
jgi:hypothetical protein